MQLFGFFDNPENGRTILKLAGLQLSYINSELVHRPDYSFAISKIQNKYKNHEKIRVGFLVNENCKWNAENLYSLLEDNEYFEPVILVTLYDTRHKKQDMTKTSVQDNYDFFVSSSKRVVKVYDEENEKYLNIDDFDIDILFYQQPWGIDESQSIDVVSKHCVCLYYSYGITVLECSSEIRPFHEKLFKYYIPNVETQENLRKFEINCLDNLSVVGYPKLDVYNGYEKVFNSKKTIIYAPHHSYNHGLKLGTFHKNCKEILEFAKQHKEFNWIFKPHPDLKEALNKDKHFGKHFIEEYYNEWKQVGIVYEKGNYFDLFKKSDILITDCDSFLLEYMPTLNPIIRLERKNNTKLSPLGQKIIKGVYRVNSFKKCQNLLKTLENQDKDELFETRKYITNSILMKTRNASANIVNELEKLFLNSEDNSEK